MLPRKQLCQAELKKGVLEKILSISALPDLITLLTYLPSPMVSFTSQWTASPLNLRMFSLHLYHQYLPGGNNGICLQHYTVTLHSFSMEGQFSCVKHFDTLAELSFPPYSPDRQVRPHMKPTIHHYLRECISETRTLLRPQPAAWCTWNARFAQLEGQSLHSAVLV